MGGDNIFSQDQAFSGAGSEMCSCCCTPRVSRKPPFHRW